MGQLTLTTIASAEALDGLVALLPSSAQTVTVDDYVEFTHGATVSPVEVYTSSWAFACVVNTGAVELIVEVGVGSDFMVFPVVPGGHILLPPSFATIAGAYVAGSGLSIYTASGTSRATVVIGSIKTS